MASSKETGEKIDICVFAFGAGVGLIEDIVSILLSERAGKRSTICLPFEELLASFELLVAVSWILSLMVFLTHLLYLGYLCTNTNFSRIYQILASQAVLVSYPFYSIHRN